MNPTTLPAEIPSRPDGPASDHRQNNPPGHPGLLPRMRRERENRAVHQ
jgi:hypothetical protein